MLFDVRFGVFMVVKLECEVFWVFALCRLVVGYQHFRMIMVPSSSRMKCTVNGK